MPPLKNDVTREDRSGFVVRHRAHSICSFGACLKPRDSHKVQAMSNVLQRPNWYGSPVELGDLFTLKKNRRAAVCKLRSHQFSWKLQLFIGNQTELVQSQACRSKEDVLSTGERWKAPMNEKGWY
jgi:hypothetical protein